MKYVNRIFPSSQSWKNAGQYDVLWILGVEWQQDDDWELLVPIWVVRLSDYVLTRPEGAHAKLDRAKEGPVKLVR